MKRCRESPVGSVPPEPAQRWRGLEFDALQAIENCLLRHFDRVEFGVCCGPVTACPDYGRSLESEPLPAIEITSYGICHRVECGGWLWPGHGVPGLRAAQRWRGLTPDAPPAA